MNSFNIPLWRCRLSISHIIYYYYTNHLSCDFLLNSDIIPFLVFFYRSSPVVLDSIDLLFPLVIYTSSTSSLVRYIIENTIFNKLSFCCELWAGGGVKEKETYVKGHPFKNCNRMFFMCSMSLPPPPRASAFSNLVSMSLTSFVKNLFCSFINS